jgi:hypothetical protein
MKHTSPYDQVVSRKRKWTPVAVQRGKVVEGSEDSLFRALGLRHLELPVREFLQQGLEKELPVTPGVREALLSNQLDEERHDQALNYVVAAHGSDEKFESEAKHILKAWLDAPEHPLLKAAILERSVFFVILPFFRFNGDIGIRPQQQISPEMSKPMLPSTLWSAQSWDLNLRKALTDYVERLSDG